MSNDPQAQHVLELSKHVIELGKRVLELGKELNEAKADILRLEIEVSSLRGGFDEHRAHL